MSDVCAFVAGATGFVGRAVVPALRQAQATANRLTRANMNIPELIMAIQMERANILESQVMDQMEDMQKRNEWLREANAALAQLRVARPNDTDGVVEYGSFTDASGNSKGVKEWMDQNGVKIENTGGDTLRDSRILLV